jgi:hypothetical protein
MGMPIVEVMFAVLLAREFDWRDRGLFFGEDVKV